jgi:EpsI family protein
MKRIVPYIPAVLLGAGALLLLGIDRQQAMPLRGPLSEIPTQILGFQGTDRPVSPEEQQVAGMNAFVLREYRAGSAAPAFSVYVGYYEQQTQGRTIHSPRNCLPGAGWEPLAVSDREISLGTGRVSLRRYVLAKGTQKALVYYWYQGRGRISSNEYKVKWELLRDAALRGRSEEALVRIVLPLEGSEAAVDSLAAATARILIPAIDRSLPDYPNRRISGLALLEAR